jgi:hypothetical protein
MRGQLYAQCGGDLGAELVRGVEGEEIHGGGYLREDQRLLLRALLGAGSGLPR